MSSGGKSSNVREGFWGCGVSFFEVVGGDFLGNILGFLESNVLFGFGLGLGNRRVGQSTHRKSGAVEIILGILGRNQLVFGLFAQGLLASLHNFTGKQNLGWLALFARKVAHGRVWTNDSIDLGKQSRGSHIQRLGSLGGASWNRMVVRKHVPRLGHSLGLFGSNLLSEFRLDLGVHCASLGGASGHLNSLQFGLVGSIHQLDGLEIDVLGIAMGHELLLQGLPLRRSQGLLQAFGVAQDTGPAAEDMTKHRRGGALPVQLLGDDGATLVTDASELFFAFGVFAVANVFGFIRFHFVEKEWPQFFTLAIIIGIDPALKNVGLAYVNTETGGFAAELVDWSGGIPMKDFDPFKALEPWLLYFYTPYKEWLEKADAIVIERPYFSKNQPLTAMLSAFVHYLTAYCIGKVHLVEPGKVSKYFNLGKPKVTGAKTTKQEDYSAKKRTAVERALSLLWSSHQYCFNNQFLHQSILTVKKKDDICDAILIAYYFWAYNASNNGPALEALARGCQFDQWVWNLYITTDVGQKVLQLGTQALPYTLSGHLDQVTISNNQK